MGALRFRLFGIPVAVTPSFWFLTLFLQFSELARPERLAIWAGVVFSGVLLHELGHALVIRAFGFAPSIELYGMGGLTAWSMPTGNAPGPWKRLAVSLAGPFAGIALGFGTLFLAVSSGMSLEGIWARGTHAEYLVSSVVWVNAGWGLLNLIPVYPLDGGQVMASLFDLVTPGNGRVWALRVTVGIGSLVCLLALRANAMFGAAMAAYFVFQAVMSLRGAGQAGADSALIAQLAKARTALEARDLVTARVLAEAVRTESKTGAVQLQAIELLAWTAVAAQDFERAAELLAAIPEGVAIDSLLSGIVDFENGHFENAIVAFAREFSRSPGAEVAARLCEALLRAHQWERLLATMAEPRVDNLLTDDVYAALVAETHHEAGYRASAALGERLFARTKSGRDAFNVACSLARADQLDDALAWLRRSNAAGGLTRALLDSDEDLAALRRRFDWATFVAEVPDGVTTEAAPRGV
jgi:Zn-dependent protease